MIDEYSQLKIDELKEILIDKKLKENNGKRKELSIEELEQLINDREYERDANQKIVEEKKREKKGGYFSKFIVVLVVFLNVMFASKVFDVFSMVGSEPVVLIGAWFTFTTGELFLLSRIKTKEIKAEIEVAEEAGESYENY